MLLLRQRKPGNSQLTIHYTQNEKNVKIKKLSAPTFKTNKCKTFIFHDKTNKYLCRGQRKNYWKYLNLTKAG